MLVTKEMKDEKRKHDKNCKLKFMVSCSVEVLKDRLEEKSGIIQTRGTSKGHPFTLRLWSVTNTFELVFL